MRATRSYLKVRLITVTETLTNHWNHKSVTCPFCTLRSVVSNSLADIYQRAAGFGVTGAHNNLSGCIIWAVPNRGHTHLERIFLMVQPSLTRQLVSGKGGVGESAADSLKYILILEVRYGGGVFG